MEERSLSFHAKIIAEQVDLYLSGMKNHLLSLAHNSRIVDFLSTPHRTDQEVEQFNLYLDRLQSISPEEYSAIFVLDPQGVCRASTDRRFIGTDYGFRSYAHAILKQGQKLHLSDFCVGLRSLIPGVFVSAPIQTEERRMIGIMVLKVAGTAIGKLVENVRPLDSQEETVARSSSGLLLGMLNHLAGYEQNWGTYPEAYIVNQDGIIISHPNQTFLYKSLDDLDPTVMERIKESRQFLELEIESLKNPFLMSLHTQVREKGTPKSATYIYGEELRVVAISPLKMQEWTVGVSVNYSQFTYLSRILLLKLVLVVGVLFICLVFLTMFLSRLITRPLQGLVGVMERVKKGELSARVSSFRKDELGVLAESFNELLDAVEDYSKNLESKVKVRTEEIIRLQQENLRLRIIEEKERIFADLHDSIGARLTNIFICNNVAKSYQGKNSQELRKMLDKIETNCEQAIQDLKEIIQGKHAVPEGCEQTDFESHLIPKIRERLLLKNIRLSHRILNLDGERPLEANLYDEMDLICEELVSNVLKYSNASSVDLYVELGKNAVRLRFKDDGDGFHLQEAKRRGFGLRNLYKRIRRMGGSIRTSTRNQKGTSFQIVLPRRLRDE
ncbi:MAG: HAMP domain-containing protein [Spirochaetes bacterium]|nr:HAMP domain-containing protein [Spirochaetota bacterium]